LCFNQGGSTEKRMNMSLFCVGTDYHVLQNKSCDTGLEIRVLAECVYLICETTELSVIEFIYHHYFSLAAIAQSV
jgi:hypothetical protein